MSADTRTRPPYVLARAEVRAVERVSPNFVRVTFGGSELDEFGTPGDVYDARIKLVFPPASGILPDIDRETDDWWGAYLAVPEDERGSMRTYSIRELRTPAAEHVEASGTEVVVDFVLHLAPGLTGPASLWASSAAVGAERGDSGEGDGQRDGRQRRDDHLPARHGRVLAPAVQLRRDHEGCRSRYGRDDGSGNADRAVTGDGPRSAPQ